MSFRWLFNDRSRRSGDNLDLLDEEAWSRFVFDHPASRQAEEDRWYNREEAEKFYFRDPERALKHIRRLFRGAAPLLASYSVQQLVQGFWCLVSGFELPDLLKDKDISLSRRVTCVVALEELYRTLFSEPGFERIAFKYWGPLTLPFAQAPDLFGGTDRERLRDAMFNTLKAILTQPARSSFLSAAHGLVQLGHPQGREALERALAQRPGLSDEDRACLDAWMDGKVLPCPFPSEQAEAPPPALRWLRAVMGR